MKPWEEPISIETEKKIIQYIPAFDNVTLLDFGAGYGRYLNMFSKYIDKKNIYGAEIDEDSLSKIKGQGYNCFKPEYSRPELPFENEFFDYIFVSNVMEHIPNRLYKKYLSEFHRVIKPYGILLFGAPNYPFKRLYDLQKAFKTKKYRYYLLDDPTHCNKLSIARYERDFRAYFSEVRFEPTEILFENKISCIKNNRYKLRYFCDKLFGYCKKKIMFL